MGSDGSDGRGGDRRFRFGFGLGLCLGLIMIKFEGLCEGLGVIGNVVKGLNYCLFK